MNTFRFKLIIKLDCHVKLQRQQFHHSYSNKVIILDDVLSVVSTLSTFDNDFKRTIPLSLTALWKIRNSFLFYKLINKLRVLLYRLYAIVYRYWNSMRDDFRNKATIYRYDISNSDKAENQAMKRNGIFTVK